MTAQLTKIAVFVGALLGGTGAYLAGQAGASPTVQLMQVLHVVFGWLAVLPLGLAVAKHRRTKGHNITGLIMAALLLTVLTTGLVRSVTALMNARGIDWMLPLHLWSSIGLGCVVVAHVGVAFAVRPELKRLKDWHGASVAAALIGMACAVWLGGWMERVQSAPKRPQYSMPFDKEKPFAPGNVTVEGGGFVHPSRLSQSAMCGTCHKEIYQQWSESMHRYSATDPHVDIGITWFQRDNSPEAGRFCAACHNPIALLAGEYDPETTPPDTGTPPHPEGISCLVCHSIESVDERPLGNGSYSIRPPDLPLLGAGALTNALVRLDPQAHKDAMMRKPLMETAVFCGACHQQYIPVSLGGDGPATLDNQYPEWEQSHYNAEGEGGRTCNDCHMPLVEAADPAAQDGKVHSHRFVAANHAHAVASGHTEQAALTLAFLREGVSMTLAAREKQDVPDTLVVEVRVGNEGAGHSFPSGTTDISETWIELVAGDPAAPLLASGLLDSEYYLDPDAHSWRKVLVDIANVPVDLHNLAVVHGTKMDRFIAPGESDTATYKIPLKGQRSGTVSVQARLRMRKANQRWNDWLSNFDGSTVPVTDIYSKTMLVDLRQVKVPPPQPEPAAQTTPATAPTVPGMAWVPGGPAIIGDADGDPDERPVRTLHVDGFYIDRFPVTNSAYRRFIQATTRPGPVHKLEWAKPYNWTGQDYPPDTADRPVVLVLQAEAKAYCDWIGKRLPSEPEWEKAARGPKGLRYPWGDTWEAGACPDMEGVDVPDRVGMCPNRASPYGVHDMVGGVWEWTGDDYRAYDRTALHPNANEWINTYGDPLFALRGVPAGHVGPHTTAAGRAGHADNMRTRVGFRCAKDGPTS